MAWPDLILPWWLPVFYLFYLWVCTVLHHASSVAPSTLLGVFASYLAHSTVGTRGQIPNSCPKPVCAFAQIDMPFICISPREGKSFVCAKIPSGENCQLNLWTKVPRNWDFHARNAPKREGKRVKGKDAYSKESIFRIGGNIKQTAKSEPKHRGGSDWTKEIKKNKSCKASTDETHFYDEFSISAERQFSCNSNDLKKHSRPTSMRRPWLTRSFGRQLRVKACSLAPPRFLMVWRR